MSLSCLTHNDFDRRIALFGLIVSSFLCIFLLAVGKILYFSATIFLIIPCLLWIFYGRKLHLKQEVDPINSINLSFKSATLLFYILLVFSLMSVLLRSNLYERPIIYFVIVSIMATSLAFSITCSHNTKSYKCIILINIVVFGAIISLSPYIIFPGLIGVDTWIHKYYTELIVSYSHVPGDFSYSKIPLFHLLLAENILISNLNYRSSTIFISFIQIICDTLFTFILGNFITKNYKIGLLSSLFLINSNYHILRIFWFTPNSLAVVYFPSIIFLLYYAYESRRIEYSVLSLILIFSLILTHTMASLAFSIVLFVIYITSKLFRIVDKAGTNTEVMNLNSVTLYSAILLFWWTYVTVYLKIFSNFLANKFSSNSIFEMSANVMYYTTSQISYFETFLSYIPEFIFYSVSFIGVFYMLSKKSNKYAFSYSTTGPIILLVSFTAPLLNSWIIQDRWRFMGECFLVVPLALACLLIYQYLNTKLSKACYFIIIFIFSFMMVTSIIAVSDNYFLFENSGHRYAFTDSELQGVNTISAKYNGTIASDKYSTTLISEGYDIQDISKNLESGAFSDIDDKMIMIRSTIIDKPFWCYRSVYKLNYNPKEKLEAIGYNKVYESSSLSGFIR